MTREELKSWRLGLGLKQKELAKVIQVNKQTVSDWETGRLPIPGYLPLTLEAVGDGSVTPDLTGIDRSAQKWPFTTIVKMFHRSIKRVASGCWEWQCGISESGYGLFSPGKRVIGSRAAHRFSHFLFIGEIPKGLVVDHLCSNRRCVNPQHLEAVTHRENAIRGNGISGRYARATHCKRGHQKSLHMVTLSNGTRECGKCRREVWSVHQHAITTALREEWKELGIRRPDYGPAPKPQTHCKRGHEFNEQNSYVYQGKRYTRRICRICKKAGRKK